MWVFEEGALLRNTQERMLRHPVLADYAHCFFVKVLKDVVREFVDDWQRLDTTGEAVSLF